MTKLPVSSLGNVKKNPTDLCTSNLWYLLNKETQDLKSQVSAF